MTTPDSNGRPTNTDYRRHTRALEVCAQRLERGDLDPQEALEVYREAEEHYQAADRILRDVERAIARPQQEEGGRDHVRPG
jgi:exonuclease VII small subunit